MEFDFIIIGAGSAGCVLADRLSEDPATSVLLIESGPRDANPLIHIPRAVPKLLVPGGRHVWTYDAYPGGNRAKTVWVKGRGLGGSSSVNGMIYVRGHQADYDGWKALGCDGWGWAEIAPCFAALEDHELGSGGGRGVGGPLKVTIQPREDWLCEAILKAAEAAGTPRVEDVNDAPDGGFGYQPCTIWRGRRQSAARAFMTSSKKRANLTVLTDTDVVRITFTGHKATGVILRREGAERYVASRREVILAAGAIASPKLLQLSGIGGADLLGALGIPVIVDAPEVGRNLQDHFNYKIVCRVTQGSLNRQFVGPRLMANMLRYVLFQNGPMSRSVWELGGFIKTNPDLARPDAQIGVGLYSMGAKGVDSFPGLTLSGYVLNPRSRGEVRITSPDFDAMPYINANFLNDQYDQYTSIALIRYIRKIMSQDPLRSFVVREEVPGSSIKNDDEILQAFLDRASTAFHVCGTCRMGSDEAAVVDTRLRVRGVDGLRVVDTSIFPTLVSGNTNAPAMAMAWRASDMILEDARSAAPALPRNGDVAA